MHRQLSAAIAVLALAAAGCGSSGGGGGGATQTTPRATTTTQTVDAAAQKAAQAKREATAYRRRANAVCRENYLKSKHFAHPKYIRDLKPLVQKDVKLQKHSLGRFRALDPPDELQAAHDRIIAAEALALSRLKALERKMDGGPLDFARVKKDAKRLNRTRRLAGNAFKAAGLDACYQGTKSGQPA